MSAKKTWTKPDTMTDELWDSLPDGVQGSLPKTIEELWSQWADFRRVRMMLDDLLTGVVRPAKRVLTRVSLIDKSDRDVATLAIADAKKGSTDLSLFHRGGTAFSSLAMCLWKASQDDAEWKVRERRSSGGSDASQDSPFGSAAF